MASDKIAMILRAKTDLSSEEISQMSDSDAWKLIYQLNPPKAKKTTSPQICFTGFSPSECEELSKVANEKGMHVVKSVTKDLKVLCTGAFPGPSKLEKARQQNVSILTAEEFISTIKRDELEG